MIKVAIIVGSTRPGRKADAVARWVHDLARQRDDAEYELVDIADYDLPLLDEPVHPRWASTAMSIPSAGRRPSPASTRLCS